MKRKSDASMERSQISRWMIPEEIMVEILRRLPLESLHRFKRVSRSWRSLITREIFPKTLTPQFIGFLYRHHSRGPFHYINTTAGDDDDGNTAIDPKLSFLPWYHGGFRILDCCNGLVLTRHVICDAPTFVVCNPFTKSWTRLPLTDYIGYCHGLIDFDPSISPHYKAVVVWESAHWVFISVYRSEAGRWEQKGMNFVDYLSVACRGWAFWDGDLYVHAYRVAGASADGSWRGWYETVRLGLSGGGDGDLELITFPKGTENRPRWEVRIGRRLWDGRLCSTDLDGLRLRVWTMTRGERNKEWVLEHDSTLRGLSGWHAGGPTPPVVVGFHPVREAVLIRFKHVIFAYHLREMSLVEVFRIGKDGDEFIHVSALFPFLPCSYDFLESRNDA